MSDTILQVESLYKQYRLGILGTGTLRDDLSRLWAKIQGKEDPTLQIGAANKLDVSGDKYVWALQNINIDIKKGEVVGIIGKNGAGKSTLLKLLSKVTSPTKGNIKIKGRVASLLEVGTGFHPELTGKENVFLNGAILGMNKQEIRSKIDEIIAFAGVEKYIDTPVKRYSSGMRVRLGFAVAAHLDPEILVVDEVLAVGDAEFQKKAIGKMQEVAQGEGRTVLFVSHNMASIRNLCERVVVLKSGEKVFDGNTGEGIAFYQKINANYNEQASFAKFQPDESLKAQFLNLYLCNDKDEQKYEFEFVEDIHIKMEFSVNQKINDSYIGMILEDNSGNWLFISANDDQQDSELGKLSYGQHLMNVRIPAKFLKPGTYYITLSLRPKSGAPYHKAERVLTFDVIDTKTYRGMKGLYRSNTLIAPEIDWYLN